MEFKRFLLLAYCLAYCWSGREVKSELVHQWAELDFVFPSSAARQAALDKQYYVRGNSVPIDVDVYYSYGW